MSVSAAAALALGSKALLPSLPALSALAAAAAASAATDSGGGSSSDGGSGGDIGSNRSSRGSSSSSSSAGAPSLLETAEGVALSDQVQAEAMLRAFGEDVALHTETALLQEEEGSTFFISDILKLVIAPFVAVLLDPIAGPAMRKGSDMLSGSGAAGPVAGIIAKIIGAIIALILGMIVAISVSQAVGEAVIYHCSWQTVDYVGRFVSSAVVETAVNDLNECAARNSAAQFFCAFPRNSSQFSEPPSVLAQVPLPPGDADAEGHRRRHNLRRALRLAHVRPPPHADERALRLPRRRPHAADDALLLLRVLLLLRKLLRRLLQGERPPAPPPPVVARRLGARCDPLALAST